MHTILNENDLDAILNRLRSLSVSSTRRWGSMDVTGMLQHLRLSGLMTVGELPVVSKSKRAFQMFPLKHLILYVVPFPKGAPNGARVEARRCDIVRRGARRIAGVARANR